MQILTPNLLVKHAIKQLTNIYIEQYEEYIPEHSSKMATANGSEPNASC